jgi:hypothetical protein
MTVSIANLMMLCPREAAGDVSSAPALILRRVHQREAARPFEGAHV